MLVIKREILFVRSMVSILLTLNRGVSSRQRYITRTFGRRIELFQYSKISPLPPEAGAEWAKHFPF
jgi:hypothetical protein